MTTVKLGLMPILGGSRSGSVELPPEITFYCPQCGTEAADKGQCIVSLAPMPYKKIGEAPTRAEVMVAVIVDCRTCGCYGEPPSHFPLEL